MKMNECENCGNKFSRSDNLKRHQNTCRVQNKPETVLGRGIKRKYDAKSHDGSSVFMNSVNEEDITIAVKENNNKKPKNFQLARFIDNIINKNPGGDNNVIQAFKSTSEEEEEDGDDNNMIQRFKSTSIGNGEENLTTNSDNEPVQEILSVHETAKKLNIIPESDESSEDEDIIEHSSTKKQTLNSVSEDDNEDTVLGRGNEKEDEIDHDEDDSDNENVSEWELKDRLHREINRMRVFELDLTANKALSNINLLEYIDLLKVPKFRGVFHIDELPKRINAVECGIVNLSPHEQLGTHWVCYAKVHKTRIYFDSFGRKTPLAIQKYMKTAEEFRNDTPVIARNTDIVQGVNTVICGHLCLFVLTSLLRERFSFRQVMDQLNHAFSENYYW